MLSFALRQLTAYNKAYIYKSVFSYLYMLTTGTARIRPLLLQQSINISYLLGPQQQTHCMLLQWTMAQKEGRTETNGQTDEHYTIS